MKNKFIFFTLILALVLPPFKINAAYSSVNASAYLKSHSGNAWAIMGLSALDSNYGSLDFLKNISSQNAIDYEAPILALVAAGKNPKNFSSTDYVSKLESFYSNGQLGDASILNDDIFGLLALKAAGQNNSDQAISGTIAFILSKQNSDGGWSYSISGNSDSNTTAAAISALASAGFQASDSSIAKALTFLKTAQNSDGGFTYDPKSAYGTGSDSSSTSWVIWALNSLGINSNDWSKNNNTPKIYLESTQDDAGWFHYMAGDNENSFSPVTTAYAVIALSGKSLPLKPDAGAAQYPFRIEGSTDTICGGSAAGPTALDIIINAAAQCGFSYHIKQATFGQYLDQINTDLASGNTGWMYLINNNSPDVGAADYRLSDGDGITWYFGEYGLLPTRLNLDQTQSAAAAPVTATVEYLDAGSWKKLSGAAVNYGPLSAVTDLNGQAVFSPGTGYYKIFAQKAGYIRSNSVGLQAGQPDGSGVNLSVNVPQGSVLDDQTEQKSAGFTVTPGSLDFGTITPGSSSIKQLNISNTGNLALNLAIQVTGGDVFKNGMTVNNTFWTRFTDSLAAGNNTQWGLKLTVPKGTSGSRQTGQMIIWAQ